ncbi:HNH endonuclease signature motif containing protein [Egibacter rhizosphaerae]|nr:HNH endonuclease signature motif containing protein [Egibacter rhizosphaerae]
MFEMGGGPAGNRARVRGQSPLPHAGVAWERPSGYDPGLEAAETPSPSSGPGALEPALEHLDAALDALAAVDPEVEPADDLAHATVETQRLSNRLDGARLGLLEAFDRREIHRDDGAVTAASWWRSRTRVDDARSRRMLRAASRAPELPRMRAQLERGEITLAHLMVVTDAATPRRFEAVAACEEALSELAATNPPTDVRQAVKRIIELADRDGADKGGEDPDEQDRRDDPRRELFLASIVDGLGDLQGTLDPVTREGLQALLGAFDEPDPVETSAEQRRTPAQRRHDAFAALIAHALGVPDLPQVQRARPHVLVTIDLATLLGLDPQHPIAGHSLADIARLIGVDPEDLVGGALATAGDEGGVATTEATTAADDGADEAHSVGTGEHGHAEPTAVAPAHAARPCRPDGTPLLPPPAARFGSGASLDAATARLLVREATVRAVLTMGPWKAVSVGRSQRTLPGWLRTVLTGIHRHCRGPDCDRPMAWTDAHHVDPWDEGGETDLNATLPLCRAHHQLITRDGWDARPDPTTGEVAWTGPDGRRIVVPPPI